MLSRLFGIVGILVVIFGFNVVAFLLLPSLAPRHPLLTLTVSIFLTAVVMETPWWYVMSSVAAHVLETAYLLLQSFLAFLAIIAVLGVFVPSTLEYNESLPAVIVAGVLTVVMRMPCGSILEAVCLLLLWFVVLGSIVAVAKPLVASAMETRPSFTSVFLLVLASLLTTMLWRIMAGSTLMEKRLP